MFLLLKIVVIVLFASLLGVVTQKIINLLQKLARLTHLGQFALTSMVIALATSLPEMSVAVMSALNGISQLSYGNAIGSNIANISLVIGITALAARGLPFHHASQAGLIYKPLLLTLLPFVFAVNGVITRFEGLLLVAAYAAFLWFTFKPDSVSASLLEKLLTSGKKIKLIVTGLVFWSLILVVLSRILISLAQSLALQFNLPISFIGFFLISVGTTLPELTFNLKAVSRKHPGMATANIVGSCVANSTLIIGLAALISPVNFSQKILIYLSAVEYIFILVLFLNFVVSKKKLEAWEAVLLVVLFIYYTNLEIIIR